jgi:hypothetical protein
LVRSRNVWASLDVLTHDMSVLVHFFLYVSWHVNIGLAIGIIPIEVNPTIKVACPVLGKSICLFYQHNQMVDILLVDVFYTKNIYHQCEQKGLVS